MKIKLIRVSAKRRRSAKTRHQIAITSAAILIAITAAMPATLDAIIAISMFQNTLAKLTMCATLTLLSKIANSTILWVISTQVLVSVKDRLVREPLKNNSARLPQTWRRILKTYRTCALIFSAAQTRVVCPNREIRAATLGARKRSLSSAARSWWLRGRQEISAKV